MQTTTTGGEQPFSMETFQRALYEMRATDKVCRHPTGIIMHTKVLRDLQRALCMREEPVEHDETGRLWKFADVPIHRDDLTHLGGDRYLVGIMFSDGSWTSFVVRVPG